MNKIGGPFYNSGHLFREILKCSQKPPKAGTAWFDEAYVLKLMSFRMTPRL